MSGSAAEERLPNDPRSELWGEHVSRYRFALQHGLQGQRVLDVACGAGFGLAMLRGAGSRAVGVDLDAGTLAELRRARPDLPVARADAMRLPLPDASVDAVLSFETIEHVPDGGALLADFRRVLKPEGVLILSTPNRLFGPPELHANNPYHFREYSGEELLDLLREHFAETTIHGQWVSERYRFVPFLMVRPDFSPPAVSWKLMNRLPFRVKDGLARALTGRPFLPSERDYRFIAHAWSGAHALLAVAARPKPPRAP